MDLDAAVSSASPDALVIGAAIVIAALIVSVVGFPAGNGSDIRAVAKAVEKLAEAVGRREMNK